MEFLLWQRQFNLTANPVGSGADGDLSGTVGAGDLAIWEANYGKPIGAPLLAASSTSLSATTPTANPSVPAADDLFKDSSAHNLLDNVLLPLALYSERRFRDFLRTDEQFSFLDGQIDTEATDLALTAWQPGQLPRLLEYFFGSDREDLTAANKADEPLEDVCLGDNWCGIGMIRAPR